MNLRIHSKPFTKTYPHLIKVLFSNIKSKQIYTINIKTEKIYIEPNDVRKDLHKKEHGFIGEKNGHNQDNEETIEMIKNQAWTMIDKQLYTGWKELFPNETIQLFEHNI